MLKKMDDFVWSDVADKAFEDLKRQLVEPPVLAAPIDKETLLLYVAANARAVSVAIVGAQGGWKGISGSMAGLLYQ